MKYFNTNRYHNTHVYEEQNWRHVSCGSGFDDDYDDDT
jgi:hypothetical protein